MIKHDGAVKFTFATHLARPVAPACRLRPWLIRLLLGTFLAAASALAAAPAQAQVCNTSASNTNPYIDITCPSFAGKGDAVTNPSANVTGGTSLTLTDTSFPVFASGDAMKVISITNRGVARSGAPGTITTSCGAGGTLFNGTYSVLVAQFGESSGGALTSEGPANTAPSHPTVSCSPNGTGSLVIPSPGGITGATGWNAYVATFTGGESLQFVFYNGLASTAATCSSIANSQFGCKLTNSITINNLQTEGPPPVRISSLSSPASNPSASGQSGSGGLTCNYTANGGYAWRVAYIIENTTTHVVTSLGQPIGIQHTATPAGSNCNIVINSPAAGFGATGYVVYFAQFGGEETYQTPSTSVGAPASCATLSSSGAGCAIGSAVTINSVQTGGAGPLPINGVFTTTVNAVANSTSVTLNDPVINNGAGIVTWGTDNKPAFDTALSNCPSTGTAAANTKGCTIFFPGAVLTSTTSPSGRYLSRKGFTVTQNNVVLQGGGSGGASSLGGATVAAGARASAEIVCTSRVYCLQVLSLHSGTTQFPQTQGFEMRRLGVEDMSGVTGPNGGGNAFGGLRLVNTTNFYLERVYATNFTAGSCISGDNGTQVGTILDSSGAGCMWGLSFEQGATAINVTNGSFAGAGIGGLLIDTASVGALVRSGNLGSQISGNIRLSGTQFRDFFTHVEFLDCQACTAWDTKHENITFATQASQNGFIFDGTQQPSICNLNALGYATIANIGPSSGTGINITSNCSNSVVLYPLMTQTATPVSNSDPSATILMQGQAQFASTAHLGSVAANKDFVGTCTLNGFSPSHCSTAISFAAPYTSAPVCTVSNQSSTASSLQASPSATALTITGPNGSTDTIGYLCVGNPN